MASFLEKVQTLISADLNRWSIARCGRTSRRSSSITSASCRRLQEQLNDQLVSARVELNKMRQRSDEQQALVVKQDAEVDQLLQAGLQEDALAAQDRLNKSRMAAAQLSEQVERLETEYASMVEAKAQLDARIAIMIQSEPR